jgi:hypothetical protein
MQTLSRRRYEELLTFHRATAWRISTRPHRVGTKLDGVQVKLSVTLPLGLAARVAMYGRMRCKIWRYRRLGLGVRMAWRLAAAGMLPEVLRAEGMGDISRNPVRCSSGLNRTSSRRHGAAHVEMSMARLQENQHTRGQVREVSSQNSNPRSC